MVNFGPLAAEIRWRVCGTTANFNGFHVLAALLQRLCSPEANQTLHDVWPSPGLLHYIYIFGGLAPLWNFAMCKVHITSKCCIFLYWQHYCTASSTGRQPNFAALNRGRHLYSAGRPSRWALAHISSCLLYGRSASVKLSVYKHIIKWQNFLTILFSLSYAPCGSRLKRGSRFTGCRLTSLLTVNCQ